MASEPGTILFPALLDDVISLVECNNHASATLTAGINNSVLLIPVSQISEFSASGIATILDTLVNPTTIEIVKYTSKSGSNLVIPVGGRGQQGTAAAAFSTGAAIEQRPTARHHTVLADATRAMQGAMATCLYTPSAAAGSINNTVVETSIFSLLTGGAGASRTIAANSVRSGTSFRIYLFGNITVTGAPTLRMRAYVGATLVADTTVVTIVSGTNNRYWMTVDVQVHTLAGAATPQISVLRFNYVAGTPAVENVFGGGGTVVNIDPTANRDLDITFQWGTASASNSISCASLSIDRRR